MAVALRVRKWTLPEMHRLPEDGNKYELVGGELFVTPPPSHEHETIAARLHAILAPFVQANGLGHVYRPRAVLRHRGSEVEPDLMVRQELRQPSGTDRDWTRAPVPSLVVEIASPHTVRRDRGEKRRLYLEAAVAEYWILDPEDRSLSVITSKGEDVVTGTFRWRPAGAAGQLELDVSSLFLSGAH